MALNRVLQFISKDRILFLTDLTNREKNRMNPEIQVWYHSSVYFKP